MISALIHAGQRQKYKRQRLIRKMARKVSLSGTYCVYLYFDVSMATASSFVVGRLNCEWP